MDWNTASFLGDLNAKQIEISDFLSSLPAWKANRSKVVFGTDSDGNPMTVVFFPK